MKNFKHILPFLSLILFSSSILTSCNSSSEQNDKHEDVVATYMDTTVKPGDDFFKYAVGNWVKNHPIPASENSWGIWKEVDEETYARILNINKDAAAQTDAPKGSNTQKIGDFWFTGMDSGMNFFNSSFDFA